MDNNEWVLFLLKCNYGWLSCWYVLAIQVAMQLKMPALLFAIASSIHENETFNKVLYYGIFFTGQARGEPSNEDIKM